MPSPTARRVLAAALAAASGGGAGLGYAASHDLSVLLTVPLGILLVGVAAGLAGGIGAGLALGLSEAIRHSLRKRAGMPDPVEDLLEVRSIARPERAQGEGEALAAEQLDAAVAAAASSIEAQSPRAG